VKQHNIGSYPYLLGDKIDFKSYAHSLNPEVKVSVLFTSVLLIYLYRLMLWKL
jgi:hypothetical protein